MAEASAPLRRNVCAVLIEAAAPSMASTRVLVFRRVDQILGDHRWQFPQGGLHEGETPRAGLLRELREEIGTDEVELLAELPVPIVYLYPPDVLATLRAEKPAKARFRGQAQTWFLARLRGGTGAIHFRHQPPEFDAFEWVRPTEAVARVVPFKQAAYREALTALGLLAADA